MLKARITGPRRINVNVDQRFGLRIPFEKRTIIARASLMFSDEVGHEQLLKQFW